MFKIIDSITNKHKAKINDKIDKVKEAAALGIQIDNYRDAHQLEFLVGSTQRRLNLVKMQEKVD
jgi:hypothetical protein